MRFIIYLDLIIYLLALRHYSYRSSY